MVLQGLVVGDWMSVYKVVAITRTRLLVAPHTIHQCQTMRASSATVVQTSAVTVAPVQRARFPLDATLSSRLVTQPMTLHLHLGPTTCGFSRKAHTIKHLIL